MTNTKNENFDIMKAGTHTLLQIPRFAEPADTLLRVESFVQHHKRCQSQYIKRLNLTGSWVTAKYPGGMHFDADLPNKFSRLHNRTGKKHGTKAVNVGPVSLQVVYRYSKKGFGYLNFFASSLGHVQSSIGGLLGLDDHTYATKKDCKPKVRAVALKRMRAQVGLDEPEYETDEVSAAEGSFAVASLA